eukprot:NODE_10829_length_427_cov_4.563492_g9714_i0.p1 GENE.NODE_10829_length_427_cov_4.563492_g9714_i0~~NODE_10829_length_427_cov_4.563492_g9714_i0.p1  ORF type:complete len:132 (+),score=0.45 NODE_10829_length_427_cov_4.563492_g9714_i0:28-423(+)
MTEGPALPRARDMDRTLRHSRPFGPGMTEGSGQGEEGFTGPSGRYPRAWRALGYRPEGPVWQADPSVISDRQVRNDGRVCPYRGQLEASSCPAGGLQLASRWLVEPSEQDGPMARPFVTGHESALSQKGAP